MGLIKKIKEKKRESQIKRFYNYIENAKHNIKIAINSEVAEFWYAKALGALDLAGNIGMIDFYEQIKIGNEVTIIRRDKNASRVESER